MPDALATQIFEPLLAASTTTIPEYLKTYLANDVHKAIMGVFVIAMLYFVWIRRFLTTLLILGLVGGALFVCVQRGWEPGSFAIIQSVGIVLEFVLDKLWDVFG